MEIKLDHLLPEAREIALLPAEQRIAQLRSDYWIGYSRAEQALKRLEELLNWPKKLRMPNMLIIGSTNNGKTMIVEKFRRSHLPYESDNGEHELVPVLMVQMPSNPTIQRFYATVITALGSPVTWYPSTARYETMALQLLSATKTKIQAMPRLFACTRRGFLRRRECLGRKVALL